jgi:hypothetical protein
MSLILDSNNQLTINSSTKAQINASITIAGTNTILPIVVTGDFKNIPSYLHQMYLESMVSCYGDTNVFNNTDKEPKTIEEKKSEWRINQIIKIIGQALPK